MPGWKSEYRIIESKEQFLQEWESIQSDALLVQEYIEKSDELDFHGFSIGKDVFLCLEKDYLSLPKNGFGSYIRYCVSQRVELLEQCKTLIKRIGYIGLFDIEFIEDMRGNLWFCEFNLRSVMTSYCHTGAGILCPPFWAQSMLDDQVVDVLPCKDEFLAMSELSDFFTRVVHGKTNLFRWLKECFSVDVHLLWNRKDIKPFFVAIKQKISRSFNHINM